MTKPGIKAGNPRFSLPVVPPSQVSLVTDRAVCERAYAALDSFFGAPAPPHAGPNSPIYLIRVGDWHAMVPLDENGEHYTSVLIFGPQWDFRFVAMM
jgi:hypothetical protein